MAINESLAAYIRKVESDENDRSQFTTVNNGWQSGFDILETGTPGIDTLKRFFNQSVEAFLHEWGKISFNESAPKAFSYTYSAWAVILRQGGFQHEHVHSKSTIVGIYYVETPKDGSGSSLGDLTLMDPRSGRLANRAMWDCVKCTIQPRAGTLILFPSFVSHRVDQVMSPGERISINFDVILDFASPEAGEATKKGRTHNMALFRDEEGNFFDIPNDVLEKYKVRGELKEGSQLSGYATAPTYNYEGGKAAYNYEGDKAAYNYEGGRPSYNYEGAKPSYNYEGDKAAYNYEGGKASYNYEAGRPSYNYEGDTAAYNYEGGKPSYNYEADKAAYNYEGGKPSYNYEAGRAAYNYEGGKPSYNYEAKPGDLKKSS
jgi:uncharacterized protein (TIGR02466 family)